MARTTALLTLLLILPLIGAGCGNGDTSTGEADSSAQSDGGGADGAASEDGDSADGDGDDPSATTDTTGDQDGTGGTDDGGDPTDSTDPDPDPDPDEPLPGTPFDIGPGAGERLDVVAVGHDDELNLRTRPDPSAPIVDTVAPRASTPRVISAGEGRLLDASIWWKVMVGGEPAWANFAFLGQLGDASEALAQVEAGLDDPEAPTVEALIEAVAASMAAGPEPVLTYVTPIQDASGGTKRVLIDVTKIGDDAVKGVRLALTIAPSGGGYRLDAARLTPICGRGITDDGLCL